MLEYAKKIPEMRGLQEDFGVQGSNQQQEDGMKADRVSGKRDIHEQWMAFLRIKYHAKEANRFM